MNEMLFPSAYDEVTYADYVLGGIWDDFKSAVSSVFKAGVSMVQPVAKELVYRQVTGEPKPPEMVVQERIIERPALPSWVLPVGAGLLAVLLLPKLKKTFR